MNIIRSKEFVTKTTRATARRLRDSLSRILNAAFAPVPENTITTHDGRVKTFPGDSTMGTPVKDSTVPFVNIIIPG